MRSAANPAIADKTQGGAVKVTKVPRPEVQDKAIEASAEYSSPAVIARHGLVRQRDGAVTYGMG